MAEEVKCHNMTITNDVFADPSFNIKAKSVNDMLLRFVKTCPPSQESIKILFNN